MPVFLDDPVVDVRLRDDEAVGVDHLRHAGARGGRRSGQPAPHFVVGDNVARYSGRLCFRGGIRGAGGDDEDALMCAAGAFQEVARRFFKAADRRDDAAQTTAQNARAMQVQELNHMLLQRLRQPADEFARPLAHGSWRPVHDACLDHRDTTAYIGVV